MTSRPTTPVAWRGLAVLSSVYFAVLGRKQSWAQLWEELKRYA
jgi:hypothetical protein